jgi:hypothetical protein
MFCQWILVKSAFLWLSPLGITPGSLFEQFWITFTHGWLVSSLTEIGLLVLEKMKKKHSLYSIIFPCYISLEKEADLHLNTFVSPDLRQFWLNWPCGSEEKGRKLKSLTDRQTDRQMRNNGRSEKLTWNFSSGELKRDHHIIYSEKIPWTGTWVKIRF